VLERIQPDAMPRPIRQLCLAVVALEDPRLARDAPDADRERAHEAASADALGADLTPGESGQCSCE
jgi:hypothetical protein